MQEGYYNDNNSNDENEKKVMPCVCTALSMVVLFTGRLG
jgi:hypothetical protein